MSYQSAFAPGLFKGQVVVVTGGGSGIGRCTAHELAALAAGRRSSGDVFGSSFCFRFDDPVFGCFVAAFFVVGFVASLAEASSPAGSGAKRRSA